jgi:hypothetical protein
MSASIALAYAAVLALAAAAVVMMFRDEAGPAIVAAPLLGLGMVQILLVSLAAQRPPSRRTRDRI